MTERGPDPLVARLTVENSALRNEVSVLASRLDRRTKAWRKIAEPGRIPIPTDASEVWEWQGKRWVEARHLETAREHSATLGSGLSELLVAERIWEEMDRYLERYLSALDAGNVAEIGFARAYLDQTRERWASWKRVHRPEKAPRR